MPGEGARRTGRPWSASEPTGAHVPWSSASGLPRFGPLSPGGRPVRPGDGALRDPRVQGRFTRHEVIGSCRGGHGPGRCRSAPDPGASPGRFASAVPRRVSRRLPVRGLCRASSRHPSRSVPCPVAHACGGRTFSAAHPLHPPMRKMFDQSIVCARPAESRPRMRPSWHRRRNARVVGPDRYLSGSRVRRTVRPAAMPVPGTDGDGPSSGTGFVEAGGGSGRFGTRSSGNKRNSRKGWRSALPGLCGLLREVLVPGAPWKCGAGISERHPISAEVRQERESVRPKSRIDAGNIMRRGNRRTGVGKKGPGRRKRSVFRAVPTPCHFPVAGRCLGTRGLRAGEVLSGGRCRRRTQGDPWPVRQARVA